MASRRSRGLLGMSFATAQNRARKLFLFTAAKKAGLATCYRCQQAIEDPDTFTLEHKEPWLRAADPRATFYDLSNIAFSHLACNSAAGDHFKPRSTATHCKRGHEWTPANTLKNAAGKRWCRECNKNRPSRVPKSRRWSEWPIKAQS